MKELSTIDWTLVGSVAAHAIVALVAGWHKCFGVKDTVKEPPKAIKPVEDQILEGDFDIEHVGVFAIEWIKQKDGEYHTLIGSFENGERKSYSIRCTPAQHNEMVKRFRNKIKS